MDFGEVDWAVDKQAQDLNNRLFADFTAVKPKKTSGKNQQSHVQTKLNGSTKKSKKLTKQHEEKREKHLSGIPQLSCPIMQQTADYSKQAKKANCNSAPKLVSIGMPQKPLDEENPRQKHKNKRKVQLTSEDDVGHSKKRSADLEMENISNINNFKKKRKHDQDLKSFTLSKKQKIKQSEAGSEKETSSIDVTQPKKKRKRKKKKNSNKRNKYAHLSPNYHKNETNGDKVVSPAIGNSVRSPGEKDGIRIHKEVAVDNMQNKDVIMNHKKKKLQQTTTKAQQNISQEVMQNGTSSKSISRDRKPKKRKKMSSKLQENEGIDKLATDVKKESYQLKPTERTPVSLSAQSHLSSAAKSNKKRKFNLEAIGKMLEEEEMESGIKRSKQVAGKLNKKQNKDFKNIGISEQNWDKSQKDKNRPKKGQLSLVERMQEQLKAARFRYLNEQLYTQTGKQSLQMFREDQEAFHVYHDGFRAQVSKWPINPVDIIIKQIQSRPKNQVVADFGCGDALIARTVRNQVHSFDLVAINKHVTVCDMAKVPLKENAVDIAVFCLSLMGNNLTEFLKEANRVLRKGGFLKIAEVTSRFKNVNYFIKFVEKLGFSLQHQDTGNKMFLLFDFKKTGPCKNVAPSFCLDPCVYKKR